VYTYIYIITRVYIHTSVCMCVREFVHIYIYIHIYICVYKFMYIHVYICNSKVSSLSHSYVFTRVCKHAAVCNGYIGHEYTHIHVCTHIYSYIYIYMYVCTYVCIYIYTHTYICIDIYICTCSCIHRMQFLDFSLITQHTSVQCIAIDIDTMYIHMECTYIPHFRAYFRVCV